MKNKIKKVLITLTTTLSAILLVTTATYAIGSLTPSGTAGDDTQYSLNDIYTKLTAGTSASVGSGTMTVPGSVSASFRTLTEIYNSIPETLSLSASTTTVPVGINRATTSLATIDTDLTAANIADGVTVFGVEGTLQGATTLEWSTEQTLSDWATAVSTCAGTVDGSTGWRLPTISELLAAISDDWIIDGGASPRFEGYTSYWSGTEVDGSFAWFAIWYGSVSNVNGDKTGNNYVRCVR